MTNQPLDRLDGFARWIDPTTAFRPGVVVGRRPGAASVLALGSTSWVAWSAPVMAAPAASASPAEWEGHGRDLVAAAANDVLAAGLEPIAAIVDEPAASAIDADRREALALGLAESAKHAGIALQRGAIGEATVLRCVCIGVGRPDGAMDGARIEPGDIVLGIASGGVGFGAAGPVGLPRAALVYVRSVLALGRALGTSLKMLVHCANGGLGALAGAVAPVGFTLDELPAWPERCAAALRGGAAPAALYAACDAGIGMCAVIAPAALEPARVVMASYSEEATPIGHATSDPARRVVIPRDRVRGGLTGFAIAM